MNFYNPSFVFSNFYAGLAFLLWMLIACFGTLIIENWQKRKSPVSQGFRLFYVISFCLSGVFIVAWNLS